MTAEERARALRALRKPPKPARGDCNAELRALKDARDARRQREGDVCLPRVSTLTSSQRDQVQEAERKRYGDDAALARAEQAKEDARVEQEKEDAALARALSGLCD